MSSYLWAAANRPLLGAMSSTLLLDDMAEGDHTTGVTATDTDSSPSCTSLEASADLTAVIDFGATTIVSGWQFTAGFIVDSSSIARCMGYAVTASGATWAIESSTNGTVWTPRDSGSLSQLPYQTISGSLGGVSARYVRIVLNGVQGFVHVFTATTPLSVSVELFDYRVEGGSEWTLPFLTALASATLTISGSGAMDLPFLSFDGMGERSNGCLILTDVPCDEVTLTDA